MDILRRHLILAGLGLVSVSAGSMPSLASSCDGLVLNLGGVRDKLALAVEACIYANPLVTMKITKRVLTNMEEQQNGTGPMGHVIKGRHPNAPFRDGTAPNADTFYTNAFFNVNQEPSVVRLPDLNDRYALFPILNGRTTVFGVPGKRATGSGAQACVISGPGWDGPLPSGLREYKSAIGIAWLVGRINRTGTPEDYAEVHKLQNEMKLCPLSIGAMNARRQRSSRSFYRHGPPFETNSTNWKPFSISLYSLTS